MPMTTDEASRRLSHGGTTNLDGLIEVVEALLVVWGCPSDEIPGRLKRVRDDLLGLE
jgi:hypothetical protein